MPSMSVSFRWGSATISADRLGQVAEDPRGLAIRPHAKGIGPLELQQVGDLVEGGGDFSVGHRVHPPSPQPPDL